MNNRLIKKLEQPSISTLRYSVYTKNDKWCGLFKSYWYNGNVRDIYLMVNGIEIGMWKKYYKGGNTERIFNRKNERLNGITINFKYENKKSNK